MKHMRVSKSQKAMRRLKVRPIVTYDRSELDRKIIDIVLKTLYNNADRNGLHLENEIFATYKVNMPAQESVRLWEIMLSSGLVSPLVGFGNAGKIELTKSGFQLMSQFGGYEEYLRSVHDSQQQPQTIIMPVQMPPAPPAETPALPLTIPAAAESDAHIKSNRKRKR